MHYTYSSRNWKVLKYFSYIRLIQLASNYYNLSALLLIEVIYFYIICVLI